MCTCTYIRTGYIYIIIRVHHVQKYTRAILPHAALCQLYITKLHCKNNVLCMWLAMGSWLCCRDLCALERSTTQVRQMWWFLKAEQHGCMCVDSLKDVCDIAPSNTWRSMLFLATFLLVSAFSIDSLYQLVLPNPGKHHLALSQSPIVSCSRVNEFLTLNMWEVWDCCIP